jgi:hypothetical protein
VVIISAIRAEVRGLESCQGVKILRAFTLQCCALELNSRCHCVHKYLCGVKVKNVKEYIFHRRQTMLGNRRQGLLCLRNRTVRSCFAAGRPDEFAKKSLKM